MIRAKRIAWWFLLTWTVLLCCLAGYLFFRHPGFLQALMVIIVLAGPGRAGARTLFPSWHRLDGYTWLVSGRRSGSGKDSPLAELAMTLSVFSLIVISPVAMRYPLLPKLALLGFGISMVVIGNYLSRAVAENLRAMRNPWTMADPEVWRRTHRFAGRLWFGMGLCVCPLALLPTSILQLCLFMAAMLVVLNMPRFYARRLYRRLHPGEEPPMDFDARLAEFASKELARIRARDAASAARGSRVRGVARGRQARSGRA